MKHSLNRHIYASQWSRHGCKRLARLKLNSLSINWQQVVRNLPNPRNLPVGFLELACPCLIDLRHTPDGVAEILLVFLPRVIYEVMVVVNLKSLVFVA